METNDIRSTAIEFAKFCIKSIGLEVADATLQNDFDKFITKQKLPIHSVMQGLVERYKAIGQRGWFKEAYHDKSLDSESPTVGQRSVGTVTEGLEVTDIKTGQILNVEGYGFMFGRVNTGEIQCFNIGNVSELPSGE